MNDWVDAEEELTKELCFRGTEMTNDRELLEQAAKAAGIKGRCYEIDCGRPEFYLAKGEIDPANKGRSWWNPLTDDGDALRLAVKLGLVLKNRDDLADAYSMEYVEKTLPSDPYAATRRAIVRAAAELGKTNNAEWIEYRGRSND